VSNFPRGRLLRSIRRRRCGDAPNETFAYLTGGGVPATCGTRDSPTTSTGCAATMAEPDRIVITTGYAQGHRGC